MDPNTIMTFAGKSMQVDSWVVTGFLKKTTCYLIGQQSDGKFVFVFQNPVTRTPTVLSINARDVSNLTLASPPSFSYDDALYEYEDLCDQVFSQSGSTTNVSSASVAPTFTTTKRKVSVDECNTTCPRCGSPAYQGFASLECSNCG